jgi:glyoxylase-like metal-dependent hydrolase (beta-lactamase superfamily II)
MNKRLANWIVVLTLFGAIAAPAADALQVVPVSEKLFLLQGPANSSNVAFLVTDQGVLVVDSGASPEAGRSICAAIRERTAKPIRYVVLTHSHGDHVFGLQSFPADAPVIAQENLARNLERYRQRLQADRPQLAARIAAIRTALGKLGRRKKELRRLEEEKLKDAEETYAFLQELRLVEPGITYAKRMTIRLGGETVELIHPGPAHTDDGTLVFFPGQKAVHMGDLLFAGLHPYIDRRAGSDTANWIKALQKVQGWDVEKIIPGHGAVVGKEALAVQSRYLADLRQAVADALQKGQTLAQAKAAISLPDWKGLGFADFLPAAIEAVYREMEATQ